MMRLQFAAPGDRLSILCLGAHSDDIEIGAGATLLSMMDRGIRVEVHWCVLSGAGDREEEARASATDFLANAASAQIEVMPSDSFGTSDELSLVEVLKRKLIPILSSHIAETTRTRSSTSAA
jgi:LmbE family N-acetylglucosaminyl deacetylase